MNPAYQNLSPRILGALLDYNPETGEFTWKPRDSVQWNGRFAGRPALTSRDKDGYLKGGLLGHSVKAHRIAWAIHYGEWPNIIDHINGDITDNRIANLRSVDGWESRKNMPIFRKNRSGVLGVIPDGRRWRAYITADGKQRTIGRFNTVEEAAEARRTEQLKLGFHENHGREPRASAA